MQLLTLSLVGGLLALDTTAVLQILISQPLISCTILGWLSNEISFGLHVGLLLQLIWLSQLPVGAARIPAGNLGSITGVIMALHFKPVFPDYENVLILVAIIYAVSISYLGALLDARVRNWNSYFFKRAVGFVEQGKLSALGWINILALLFRFLVMSTLIFVGVQLGDFVFRLLIEETPADIDYYARFLEMAVIGSGIGMTLDLYRTRKSTFFLLTGVVIGLAFFFI